MSKAFILTTDSLLAVVIAGLIAFSALALSTRFEDPLENARVMEDVGRDLLATLEKGNSLGDAAASGSSSEITAALDALPSGTCGSIELIEDDTVVMRVDRTGCSCGTEIVVLRRTFLARDGGAQREMYALFRGCFD